MRKPIIFVIIIFVVSAILLLLNIPGKIDLRSVKLPFVEKNKMIADFSFDPANINFSLGGITIQKDLSYKLGLDLQGGTQLTYKVVMKDVKKEEQQDAFESARDVIDRRINYLGVSEPTIQTLKVGDEYRIIVDLPGMSNVSQAIGLIGQTAQLTFWEGGKDKPPETPNADPIAFGLGQILGANPIPTKLTGKDLQKAAVVFDSTTGKPQVQIQFTSEGTKYFADITKRNIGKVVAIALDNQVISAPVVQTEIANGTAVITGQFTPDVAKNLSIALNAGALPAPLEVIAQKSVGPSLGIDSLHKSLFAAIIGFVSIIFFMSYIYRKEGLIACAALAIYTIITLFIYKLIPVTLTLAGIAGFILSIGMAVDANILIFERMKEELRRGKPRDIAMKNGFARAWTSIRDSNITSIITCVILFYFGSGIVRGFALTLFIGIIISMFSAITITKNLLIAFDSKEEKMKVKKK
ncbi:MAG: protein translocase subunit SecD [Candidatus Levybacteria bacterium]|nr:protein translocase subunit SecD [Candidatus Levybacteria bacterium]